MNPLNRRTFVKLGALATASAALSPSLGLGAEAASLPELPYAFDALEPHIDKLTMEIHHGKHHAGYVTNLNKALDSDSTLKARKLDDLLASLPEISDQALRTTVRNNGGGHWNHSFFWQILSPADKSGKPSDAVNKALNDSFGDWEKFKSAFNEAASKRFGSGWAWVIVGKDGKLKVVSTPNQDNPLMKGIVPDSDLGTPILGLDVWEHAYYLHYQNKRPDYIGNFWNIINWTEVDKRLQAAS